MKTTEIIINYELLTDQELRLYLPVLLSQLDDIKDEPNDLEVMRRINDNGLQRRILLREMDKREMPISPLDTSNVLVEKYLTKEDIGNALSMLNQKTIACSLCGSTDDLSVYLLQGTSPPFRSIVQKRRGYCNFCGEVYFVLATDYAEVNQKEVTKCLI